jgi:hypothetical protein
VQQSKKVSQQTLNVRIPFAENVELLFAAGRKVCGDYTNPPYYWCHDVSDPGSVLVWY